jgi:hypothetical protein
MKIVIRGYLPEYEKYFKGEGIEKLKKASCDTLFLLSRGYKLKPASNFVTNHYLLSEKQRLAVARSVALPEDVKNRKAKMLKKRDLKGKEVWVDGFNAIIPMETLLSDGPLFECMDGAIRDMADLKGSYKIIDKKTLANDNVEVYTESNCNGGWLGLCQGTIIYVMAPKPENSWYVKEIYAIE